MIYQAVAHGDDAVSHALYFLAPLKEEEDVSYAKKEIKKTREKNEEAKGGRGKCGERSTIGRSAESR